jgi:hypothetical protein
MQYFQGKRRKNSECRSIDQEQNKISKEGRKAFVPVF